MVLKLTVRHHLAVSLKNGGEGVYTPLFLYYNIGDKKILMNKSKLKVLLAALKQVVDEIESEVYSDTDSYTTSSPEYDEVFEDDDG